MIVRGTAEGFIIGLPAARPSWLEEHMAKLARNPRFKVRNRRELHHRLAARRRSRTNPNGNRHQAVRGARSNAD
jgi:hypothetical protein